MPTVKDDRALYLAQLQGKVTPKMEPIDVYEGNVMDQYPTACPPPLFRTFVKTGSILASTLVVGTLTPLFEWVVPTGYSGFIMKVGWGYQFDSVNGDGRPNQFGYQISINNVYPDDFGRIYIELGSANRPTDINGIFIKSGDRVKLQTVKIDAALVPAVTAYVVGNLTGFIYPTRKDQILHR